MAFLRKRKKRLKPAREAETTAPVRHPKKRKVTPVEVKLLAIDALKAGITSSEVCELIGVSISIIGKTSCLLETPEPAKPIWPAP